MKADNPLDAVAWLDEAFNRGDVDAILDFYEDQAVLVVEPGGTARGKEALRRFFEYVLQSRGTAKQERTHVLEADGIALFLSRWTLSTPGPNGSTVSRQFTATSVFRRQADGGWKLVIDNAFGPAVLETDNT